MKKPIAILLSLLLAGQALGWTVSADAPYVGTMDGQRTAFVSSFGRINCEGKSHTAMVKRKILSFHVGRRCMP